MSETLLLVLALLIMVLSLAAQGKVQRTFKKHASTPAATGLTAMEIADRLLRQNGSSVRLTAIRGSLTDHFDPRNQVVALSEPVAQSCSISAIAVAAHEIGHVMQYESDYGPIRLRNRILPVASFSSKVAPFIVLIGLLLRSSDLAMAGAVLFGAVLLFQLVTLPVEFDASNRALRMLEEGGYVTYDQSDAAREVLNAAAMTYVYAALATLVTFLRYFALASRGRRRN